MYLVMLWALVAANPITIDAGVVVQIEVAVIGALGAAILKVLHGMTTRLTTIEATLDGPKGNGGLEARVARVEADALVASHLRLRTVTDYIGWRRRVETVLRVADPTFELTPDHHLLDLLCGEMPE